MPLPSQLTRKLPPRVRCRQVGFRVHDKNDAAGAPQADRRRRLQSIDISATQPWGAQTLGQVYAHRVVRTAYSWRQHAECVLVHVCCGHWASVFLHACMLPVNEV